MRACPRRAARFSTDLKDDAEGSGARRAVDLLVPLIGVSAAASRRFLTLDSLTTLDQARREPEALVEAPEPIT